MLLWLITPNVSWWHPPNFHDQLISPRPSAADRSLALRRWVKSSPPLMHSMISAYVTIVESLFLGGIYRYINKQIHTYIYIYYIIYKYSKPYSCNTWETWQSDDPTRWSYTQPRFTEFQRNSCCCSGSKCYLGKSSSYSSKSNSEIFWAYIYIYMHTYVIYIYTLWNQIIPAVLSSKCLVFFKIVQPSQLRFGESKKPGWLATW